jgi:hypothetical protein
VKTFTAPIASIRRDGGTQIRAALDEATVAAYAEAIKAGVKLPPVRVFDDKKTLWLSDGFHRVEARLRAGGDIVEVERLVGGKRDALIDAIGANAAHGLPRSNADKRRAIEAMLADPEWVTWTDRRIAATAHVGHELVARVREESIGGNAIAPTRQATDGRKFPASPGKASKPGQPTAVTPTAANPVDEGEKAAGEPRNGVLPAADEPGPAEEAWFAKERAKPMPDDPRDRLVNVERLLRDAQAEIAPLLAKGEAMALQGALNDALRVVRVALGDGSAERLTITAPAGATGPLPVRCSKCGGNKCGQTCRYESRGEMRPVKSPEKIGRYSPPPKALRIEDEAGNELSIDFEPIDDTDAF